MMKANIKVYVINTLCIIAIVLASAVSVQYLSCLKPEKENTATEQTAAATPSYIVNNKERLNDGIHTTNRNEVSGDLEAVMKKIAEKTS